jgi:hypothetical protein
LWSESGEDATVPQFTMSSVPLDKGMNLVYLKQEKIPFLNGSAASIRFVDPAKHNTTIQIHLFSIVLQRK